MMNALFMIAGAAVFCIGFYLGISFDFPKGKGSNQVVIKSAGVIKNEEYQNFLNYDGTERN